MSGVYSETIQPIIMVDGSPGSPDLPDQGPYFRPISGLPLLGIWTLCSSKELLQSKVCKTKVVGTGETESLDQLLVGRPNLGIWTLWCPRTLLQSKVCAAKVLTTGEIDSLDQLLVGHWHQGAAGRPNLDIWTLWSTEKLLQLQWPLIRGPFPTRHFDQKIKAWIQRHQAWLYYA